MPQVKQMAETDNTLDELTQIERQQPQGTAEAHDSDEMPHEFTKGIAYDNQFAHGSPGDDRGPSVSGPGDTQALNAPANSPAKPGSANSMVGTVDPLQTGAIYKNGIRGGSDTYETPGGAAAPDYSADRLGNETGQPGDTPAAGDVDPDSTYAAEETGQDGDPTRPGKSHGKPWDQ